MVEDRNGTFGIMLDRPMPVAVARLGGGGSQLDRVLVAQLHVVLGPPPARVGDDRYLRPKAACREAPSSLGQPFGGKQERGGKPRILSGPE